MSDDRTGGRAHRYFIYRRQQAWLDSFYVELFEWMVTIEVAA